GKSGMYRVRNLCRVSGYRHSANMMFAECPWFGTRQRNEHSAYMLFPVVSYGFCTLKLNNLKVIHDLYFQCLTQILSKTTFFTSLEGVVGDGRDLTRAGLQIGSGW